MVATGAYSMEKIWKSVSTKSMVNANVCNSTSSFVLNRRKKPIQGWNKLSVSKIWENFYFWVNYPVKHVFMFFLFFYKNVKLFKLCV